MISKSGPIYLIKDKVIRRACTLSRIFKNTITVCKHWGLWVNSSYVSSLHIKVCEVEGDFVLFRGLNLPHTGLGGWVRVRKRRTVQGPGLTLQITTTRICREVNIYVCSICSMYKTNFIGGGGNYQKETTLFIFFAKVNLVQYFYQCNKISFNFIKMAKG